jgi:hypothetical protein
MPELDSSAGRARRLDELDRDHLHPGHLRRIILPIQPRRDERDRQVHQSRRDQRDRQPAHRRYDRGSRGIVALAAGGPER